MPVHSSPRSGRPPVRASSACCGPAACGSAKARGLHRADVVLATSGVVDCLAHQVQEEPPCSFDRLHHARPWATTPGSAIGTLSARSPMLLRVQDRTEGQLPEPPRSSSSACSSEPGSPPVRRGDRGRTTFATASPCGPCSAGIAPALDVDRPAAPALHLSRSHASRASTYWYLSRHPELMVLAAERLERAEQEPVMSALAPEPRSLLHRAARPPAPGQPAHRGRLSRHLPALGAFARPRTGKEPCELDFGDLDAALIGAFLEHLESRAAQQRAHSQRPSGRGSFLLPVRRPAPSRARRPHRPGARHPRETYRPGRGVVT